MKHGRIGWGITLSFFMLMAAIAIPASANNARLQEASALYQQGEYKQAYKKYLKLGKEGDAYSAYRVSYMQLYGQGTKTNFIESLAWATVAAKQGETDLVDYRDTVAAIVPEDERKKANSKVDYFMRRWGGKKQDSGRHHAADCTGSRVSSNCSPTSSREHWIAWPKESRELRAMQPKLEQLNQSIGENFANSQLGDSAGG